MEIHFFSHNSPTLTQLQWPIKASMLLTMSTNAHNKRLKRGGNDLYSEYLKDRWEAVIIGDIPFVA